MSARENIEAALSGPIGSLQRIFQKCFEEEHITTVTRFKRLDRVLLLAFLLTSPAQVDCFIMKSVSADHIILALCDSQ